MRVTALSALLSLLLLAAAAPPPSAQAAEPIVGQVVDLRGGVTVMRAAASQTLVVGVSIHRGDRVRTDHAGRVRIALRDGSTLTLGPESEVEISVYLTERDRGVRGRLTLLIGIIRTVLGGPDWRDGFEVETRAAVASVRSTDWMTEVDAEGTAVFVVDGEVAVVSPEAGVGVLLGPGFGTDVAPGERPADPKRWGQKRVDEVLARTSLP